MEGPHEAIEGRDDRYVGILQTAVQHAIDAVRDDQPSLHRMRELIASPMTSRYAPKLSTWLLESLNDTGTMNERLIRTEDWSDAETCNGAAMALALNQMQVSTGPVAGLTHHLVILFTAEVVTRLRLRILAQP